MKVLLKKLKRCNKIQKTFYSLTSLLYLISFIFFTINILKLSGIETAIRIIIIIFFGLWFLLYILGALVSMIIKKKKTYITLTTLSIIFSTIFITASIIISFLISSLSSINKEYILYTSNLIALNETEISNTSKIGMISNENDIEGYILANKLIEKEKAEFEIIKYDDYFKMAHDMYEGTIDGLFVSNNYAVTFSALEKFDNIADEVKVVYSYSEEMENQDNITTTKKLTEPFTMLIMGVDSSLDGLNANQAFNGDTLILVTFNPKTLTATMLSIPRDLYVPIACRNNEYDKINSSAAYGSTCVIDTVENLTEVEIDYYLKMNFQGVVDLVDALGGVDVNVAAPYYNTYNGQVCEQDSKRRKGSHLVCMNPGYQTLNGEQALAYARCRKLYLLSDIDRNAHQQDVIEAMIQKVKKIDSIDKIKSILNAVSKNMDTNMTTEQILSFYNVCKEMLANANTSNESLITIKKSYIEWYDLNVYLPQYNIYTSAISYYEKSLEAIKDMMKVNLELKEAEMIKTYNIDYNEDYTSKPVGKGLTDSSKLELLPDFTGQTEDYVRAWCNKRNIDLTVYEADSYNPIGMVISQDTHKDTFVKRISHITIYVSNGNVMTEDNKSEIELNDGDTIIDNEE